MSSPPPPALVAARLLNSLNQVYAASDSSPQLEALLSYIYVCNDSKQPVCSTDLVRERRFGTLPTVTAMLTRLSELGLLEARQGTDKRVKLLYATKAGQQVLEKRAELIENAAHPDAQSAGR